jgi:hypothetical protein
MIVVVANRWDQIARVFASRCADDGVRLLTPQDLSAVGWRQPLRCYGDSRTVVVEKKLVPQKNISAVVTRIPCVMPEELSDIVPADRPYVAAEMTAFLLFWLSSLKCRVINRPTPSCLSGPFWRQESWVRAAVQAGIPVDPVCRHATFSHRSSPQPTDLPHAAVTVVGDRVFGDTHTLLQSHAQRLAEHAGAQQLVVRFSTPERDARFLGADVYPDLSQEEIGRALLQCLELSGAAA